VNTDKNSDFFSARCRVCDFSSSMGMIGRRQTEEDSGENPRLALQQFVYDDDGFIACRADPNLVLGVHEHDSGPAATVCLVRRRDEDVYQRWIIHDNGYQLISALYCWNFTEKLAGLVFFY